MITRQLGNMVSGFLLGALTSRLYGKHLSDFAADGARRIGSAARNVVDAFAVGYKGTPKASEDGGTSVEVSEE